LKMAALGVEAGAAFAKTGKKASGYIDTGVTLISDRAQAGVASRDSAFGQSGCWGK
jgi:fructose transport system substrate-binding protein